MRRGRGRGYRVVGQWQWPGEPVAVSGPFGTPEAAVAEALTLWVGGQTFPHGRLLSVRVDGPGGPVWYRAPRGEPR